MALAQKAANTLQLADKGLTDDDLAGVIEQVESEKVPYDPEDAESVPGCLGGSAAPRVKQHRRAWDVHAG